MTEAREEPESFAKTLLPSSLMYRFLRMSIASWTNKFTNWVLDDQLGKQWSSEFLSQLSKYLLSTYYVPDTVIGTGDTDRASKFVFWEKTDMDINKDNF